MKFSKRMTESLMNWYQKEARDLPWRMDQHPYHVWLSEIMLQQTRVEAVKGYYTRFLSELPDIRALAEAEEERLLKLWEGLGYYNRARNLQKAAKVIQKQHQGEFPSAYSDILSLPGIGPYTAGAIASICYDLPTPAVDGNVLRVAARVAEIWEETDLPRIKQQVTAALAEIYPQTGCGIFTQSIMELGAMVCIPNGKPKCEYCPISDLCLARCHGSAEQLPVKKVKKARDVQKMTVYIAVCKDKVAIQKREEPGVLQGLWEFPNVKGWMDIQAAVNQAADWCLEPQTVLRSVRKKHIFTHKEWHMTGYYIDCKTESEQFVWVTQGELSEKYALPTAFKIFQDTEVL